MENKDLTDFEKRLARAGLRREVRIDNPFYRGAIRLKVIEGTCEVIAVHETPLPDRRVK